MSKIRGKDTKPEILLRKRLFQLGFRYRINDKKLPGKPDIVLRKYNTIIFVNGCFWHGHKGCRYFVVPKTRTQFWTEKINGNISRDNSNILQLESSGWQVLTVWECELKKGRVEQTLEQVVNSIRGFDSSELH